MSASRRSIALSVLVLCAFALILSAAPVHAQPPEAPINLQVMPMGPDTLQLYWEPAPCCGEPVEFLVYRNGELLTLPGQEIPGVPGQPFYTYDDIGLAPATPHTYTVQARNTVTLETSPMSERVAWMTDPDLVMRVPQEAPTIYDAVMAATPGTTIYITPGIYLEMQPLDLGMMGKSGITIKGQDPEGVVLEMMAGMGDINLDPAPGTNNTLSGVTLSGGSVIMGPGDTVTNCVFLGSPNYAVSGGGFVTNSVFDFSMGIDVPDGESMLVANSIFLNGDGIWFQNPDDVYLLNNNFNYGFNWIQLPGDGNYDDYSCFEPESPPEPMDPFWYPSYIPCPSGPDQDRGAFVGLFVYDGIPDVGAFEVDEPYTPQPPKDLTVVMEQTQPGYTLRWTASPDDPYAPFPPPVPSTNLVDWYLISRSDNPDMVNPVEFIVPAVETTFVDTDTGITYPSYYQVRAIGQFPQMPPMPPLDFEIVSMPTNTVTTDEPYLRLNTVSPSTVEFFIDFYPYDPWPGMVYFNVYRNGQLLTPSPIPEFTSFADMNLAPDTPHLYTAQAVMECFTPPDCYYPPGGLTSMMSMPFGVMTETGNVLQVPSQLYPTIQSAVSAAFPGTTIRVAPGTYQEDIYLGSMSGIAIVGQDAQGVVLDLSTTPSQVVDLDSAPGTANTISGFTILGGTVFMGEGDTVSNCVFRDSPSASVQGGGFVTNSVFDGVYGSAWTSPPVVVDPDMFMEVANSVFLTDGYPPFLFMEPSDLYLRNNAADYGAVFDPFIPGEGNFQDPGPGFMPPGPPDIYAIEYGPCINGGVDVGLPFYDFAPDVGAFEWGLPFTPEPPENLTATWNSTSWSIDLAWWPSPSPQPITEYLIYRSESPGFPSPDDSPIMAVPAGQLSFQDFTVDRGTTYYYQVRANSGGPVVPPEEGVLSLPSGTASATANLPPVASDDSFSADFEMPILVPVPGVLGNDTDPDFDPLAAVIKTLPLGDLVLMDDGSVYYTPPPAFVGDDTFTYVANDGFNDSNIATVTITVVNSSPAAVDDSYSVKEGDTLIVDPAGVLLNDTDPEGAPLTATLVSDVTNGWLTLNPLGDFVYTPYPGFSGTDTFTYAANDGFSDSNIATVTITVDANNAPVADDQNLFPDEDTAVAITLTASDDDGDILTFSVVDGPVNGTLSGNAPDLTYTPDADYHGPDSFTFTAFDGMDVSNTATVMIDIAPVNDAPVANDLFYGAYEDITKVVVADFGILRHIVDPDGDPLTVHLVSGPVHAQSFILNLDGSFTYDPAPNYFGPDSFTYKLNDGTADSNTATVSINVVPGNDVPVAEDQSVTTDEDTPKAVTLTGSDIDGDSLTFSVATTPANGTLSGTAPNLTYTPDVDFNGSDSFTFTANDGTATSNAATVSITVNAVSDAPVANNQNVSTPEDTAKDITLTGSDADGDSLTYAVTAGPSNGSLSGTAPNLTYIPNADFSGSDSFTFTANDGTVDSNTATVSITVNAVNDAPVGDNQAVVTDEDTAVGITLTGSDIDGDPLTFAVGTGPSNGTLSGTAPNLTYTPNADFSGSDSFTFTADDGTLGSNTATVSITVNAVNDAPVADDQAVVTNEDTAVAITLTASDTEGDPLTYAVGTGPSNGTLTGTAPNLTYIPNADFNGSDSFTFTADDGALGSNTATVSITVNAVNDAPAVTNPGTQNNAEGDVVSLPIPASDVDGDTLAYSATGLPSGLAIDSGSGLVSGTLTYDSAGSHSVDVTVTDGQDPASVNFTWNVTDVPRMHVESITTGAYVNKGKTRYTADVLVLDDGGAPVSGADVTAHWAGTGADTTPSTLSTDAGGVATFETNGIKKPSGDYVITIDDVVKSDYLYDLLGSVTSGQYPPPAQNPPVAYDDSYSVDEGTQLNVPAPGVLGNDTDAESDPLTAVLAGGPSHGILSLNPDGSFSYTHDGSETTSDSFTYRANDGTVDSNTATVTITINPVNDPPTAADDSASTQQDTAVVVDVLANDSDPDGDILSVSAVTQGASGSVVNNGTDVTYTPDPGYTGPDFFTYTADDGNGGTDTATVNVTVFAQNDPPTAVDDSASSDEDGAVVIDVLANDSDPDSDPLTVSAVTQGSNGTVVNNGSDVTYTPDPDYHGSDSFTYTANDGNGGTDTATVTVTVLPVNDAPVAANDSASTTENTAVIIDVLANDSDADGDTLTVLSATQGANGTVLNSGGNVTYTPDPGYTGPDSFTYTAYDGNGGTDTATVSVTVTPSNFLPVADAGPDLSGERRDDLTFDGSGSTDDGTITSWQWDFGDGKSGGGEIVVHDYKKTGTYTVTLTVTDDQGAQDTDTATVTIN